MKTICCVTLAIVLALPASGEIALFWSTTGINNPDFMYSTALTNFLPYFVRPTRVTELPAGAYDLFLWGQFIEDWCVYPGCRMYGLDLMFGGNATVAQNVAYRHQKTGPCAYKRWDGSQGILLHGVMAAITAQGIEFIVPPETNCDLYFPDTHEFLVGAARVTGTPGQTIRMSVDTDSPLDGLGIAWRCIPECPDGRSTPLVTAAVVTFFAVGDVSGDNLVTFDDIDPFVFALSHSEAEFRATYPAGHYRAADCNHDGVVNFDDIDPFVECLSDGLCP